VHYNLACGNLTPIRENHQNLQNNQATAMGELSMGQNVPGESFPWGKLSMGQGVFIIKEAFCYLFC
jgi:hypothetical protein